MLNISSSILINSPNRCPTNSAQQVCAGSFVSHLHNHKPLFSFIYPLTIHVHLLAFHASQPENGLSQLHQFFHRPRPHSVHPISLIMLCLSAPEAYAMKSVNPVARCLLAGALLPGRSPLRHLQHTPELLELIFRKHIHPIWKGTLQPSAELSLPTWNRSFFRRGRELAANYARRTFGDIGRLMGTCKLFSFPTFPPPADRMCNMLPIRTRDPSSIPSEFRAYAPLIEECERRYHIAAETIYLTVHESLVIRPEPQRRPGIHTDGFLSGGKQNSRRWHFWGGNLQPCLLSGILHASSVSNSCRIWNVQIPRRESKWLKVGCDLEHLREVLDDVALSVQPQKNEMYWMSDATPHESLPLEPGTYRQFFRLVVGDVTTWWRQHSTANRLGVQPDATICEHSKFEPGAYNTVWREGRQRITDMYVCLVVCWM